MKPMTRWIIISGAALLLLVAPTVVREWGLGYNQRSYQPPAVPTAAIAATPQPTLTPVAIATEPDPPQNELKRGPVVVDLAHLSPVGSSRFQPLAAALAGRGLDLVYWLPTVDPRSIEDVADFPDLAADLGAQLADATALIVVSPLYQYNPTEVAIVEQFVADGGRLLLISDPDVAGDHASISNVLAAPFNVVFNEDYLYDTVDNDENYTHFYQGGFFDRAAGLEGAHVAFYGGRSLSGAMIPQVRSADTTLSSLRNGITGFTTVAIGGQQANKSVGRVLAMSDFDVLTDPFVTRQDNRQLLDFVASFLTGAQRENTIEDFPAFLGKEVALVIDNTEPVGAAGLSKAAELQRFLEASGRTLTLAPNSWLNETEGEPGLDLMYVAGYRAADNMTTLLHDLGINLVEVTVTPTPAATAPAQAPPGPDQMQSSPPEETDRLSGDDGAAPPTPIRPATPVPEAPLAPAETPVPGLSPAPESTPSPTATLVVDRAGQMQVATAAVQSPSTPVTTPWPDTTAVITPAVAGAAPAQDRTIATATPEVILYLERKDGIRLVADETQLFIQRPYRGDQKILAVLGNSEAAINSGVTRLLNRDLAGCLAQEELIICPYAPGAETASAPPSSAPIPTSTPAATRAPAPAPGPQGTGEKVLLVDDNSGADETERSEAAVYLMVLTEAGYAVDLWTTGEEGFPDDAKLAEYRWVIWSDAGYTASGISGESLRLISNYINQGGHVTVSSREPFFGMSNRPPSPIKDIVLDDDLPELVAGLPKAPIALAGNLPDVTPLESNPEPSTGARIALRRGADSDAVDAPVLVVYSDVNFEEPKGALLMLFGMSISWLPDDVAPQLVRNMATFMLAE